MRQKKEDYLRSFISIEKDEDRHYVLRKVLLANGIKVGDADIKDVLPGLVPSDVLSLTKVARDYIKSELLRIKGVADIFLYALTKEQYTVSEEQYRLNAWHKLYGANHWSQSYSPAAVRKQRKRENARKKAKARNLDKPNNATGLPVDASRNEENVEIVVAVGELPSSSDETQMVTPKKPSNVLVPYTSIMEDEAGFNLVS